MLPRRLDMVAVLTVLLALPPALADDYPRNPDIDIVNYRFHLRLSDTSDEILGRTEIEVRFKRPGVESVTVDLIGKDSPEAHTGMTVESVTTGQVALPYAHTTDRLTVQLSTPSRANELRMITVVYRGIPADGLVISENKHGDRTFFGDNFSTRFRHWLVGIDHPSDKATCEFVVTTPNHYQVIANGILVEESDLGDDLRLHHWRQSVPISTYLMVIGVARFAVQQVDVFEGIPIQTWVYPQDRDAGFYDFARSRRPLAFFSSHVGPYPYEKLANVQSKTRYGGMENASNIFYSERSVSGQRRGENTITHEIAHQWFGDSVTEADWNHVWLSEGFATYFTSVFNEFTYGRDRFVKGMQSSRERITRYWRRAPDSPVVDLRVPADRILQHSTNVYQKGAWVLHMLRHRVGDEMFWAGIREYYRRFRDSTAMTADLRRVFEEVSGQDLERFFEQWIFQPGHPILKGTWRHDADQKQLVVELQQTQDSGVTFHTELEIEVTDSAGARLETVRLDGPTGTFRIATENPPTSVKLDPHTWLLMEAEFGGEAR